MNQDLPTLYANEQFPRRAVTALRALGFKVMTTHDEGQSNRGIADDKVLDYATQRIWVVVTLNRRDFIRLHETHGATHAGIVVCTHKLSADQLAQRIHEMLRREKDVRGRLLRIVHGDRKLNT